MLLQNWTKCIEQILSQHPELDEEMKDRKIKIIKKVFSDSDIDGALNLIERKDRLEKVILLSLKKNPNGYYNAFGKISRNTRFIYIHAY